MDQKKKNNPLPAIILGVVLIIAALGAWIFLRPTLPVENIFPSKALFFARITHAQAHWEHFKASEFYKNLASIDIPKVMAHNHYSPAQISRYKQVMQDIRSAADNPLLQKIWNKEAAIAIYPSMDNKMSRPQYNFIFAARLDTSAQAAEFMGHLFRQWREDLEYKEEFYKGVKITHLIFSKKKLSVSYVRVRDLLIATLDPSPMLPQVIDVLKSKGAALKDDDKFKFIQQRSYPSADGMMVVNMEEFTNVLRNELSFWSKKSANSADEKHKLDQTLNTQMAFPAYGFSFLASGINHYKFIAAVNPQKMTPDMRRVYLCPGNQNASSKFIPANVIAYNWGTCYDFKEYWNQVNEGLSLNNEMSNNAHKVTHIIEKRLKVNIATDILPMFGDELGGYLTDIDTNNIFPFPRMLLFIKVKDKPGVEALLNKGMKTPLGMMQSEDYEGTRIEYLTLPLGANIDPGYCFINDYLLFATSRQLLKRSIDAFKVESSSLKTDKDFKLFDLDHDRMNSLTFLKTGEMANRLIDVTDWINKYLNSQINLAGAYKEDGKAKQEELTQGLKDKSKELALAQKKLDELKAKALQPPTVDPTRGAAVSSTDATVIQGAIENLQREIQALSADIQSDQAQVVQLKKALATYDVQASEAKVTIYNLEHVLIPVFKGCSTLDAQSIKVKLGDKALETEFLLKS